MENTLPTNCQSPHIVYTILDFILKHSTFRFMETHIHQILDSFMGTRMAHPDANLFMLHNPNFLPPNLLLEIFHR